MPTDTVDPGSVERFNICKRYESAWVVSARIEGQTQRDLDCRVSGNWRITFRFDGPDAYDVNYEDYH